MISSRKLFVLAPVVAAFAAGLSWSGISSVVEGGFFSEARARSGDRLRR
jgi:hypothetical protein